MAHNGSDERCGSDWYRDDLCSVTDRSLGFEVSRRSLLATSGTGILGGLFVSSGTAGARESDSPNAKTRTTIWTEGMRENARQNVRRYDWAKAKRDDAVASASEYLDRYDLDDLWSMVTSQRIPRGGGTPHFRQLMGGYSDPGADRPWKIETRDGYTVPTNDFAAYRESGLDDRGTFDPALADDQYLVNEEHPEMGEGWGVDDGTGWIDENGDIGSPGEKMNFVAYYNHWFVWRPGGILATVRALTDAYLLTGDRRYSRAGTIVLDRIADVYPEMRIGGAYQQPDYWNNHGGRQTGKVLGGSWEPNLVRDLLRAYDAFFPGMADDDDLVAFLDAKTDEYPGLDGKGSIEEIRENIEDDFIREMLPAAKNSQLVPNRGQLSTVAISARVLDEPGGYTREAIEWIFQPGGERFVGDVWNEEPENWITTGGDLLVPIVDVWDRDGYSNQTAPLYNRIEMESIRQVAEALKGYDGFDGADLYQHPKFRHSLDVNSELILLDRHSPELGDTHSNRDDNWLSQSAIEDGYEVVDDERFAQLWHFANGHSTAGIRGDIFDAEPEGLSDDVAAIIDAEGPFDLPSQNLAGYGFAALRDGENYRIREYGDVRRGFLSLPIVDQSTETKRFDDIGYIQLESTEAGDHVTFEFDVPETDEYQINVTRFLATSYGVYEISIDGELVETHDFYDEVSGAREEFVELVDGIELEDGAHTITFQNVGKHGDSTGYKFAVNQLQLLDPDAQDRKARAETLGNTKRAFWLYYGRNNINAGGSSHNHGDALNLGVAAHDLELSPDLGYPEETGSHPKRVNWTANTISHNTVTVDKSRQDPQWVADPRHFEGSDERVNLIDVDARHAYEQCDAYRRSTATITVDDEHSYAVDFFRVVGGDDHRFSFHGAKGAASAEGVDLVPQDGGTYAGPDIPKPGYGEDSAYNREVGSGFNYLTNVERDADPGEKVAVDWDVEDHWDHRSDDAEGVHMRLTTLGDLDEVALADGRPPDRNDNPDVLRYALFERSGSDLESTFVSTIEHYDGQRVVDSVERVDVEGGDGHAVKVELVNGRTDYVVCAFDENSTVSVDDEFRFQGFFGYYSVEGGEPEYAYVHDGTRLGPTRGRPLIQKSRGFVRGFVEDFTREMSLENELELRIPDRQQDLEERISDFVYVDNDGSDSWRGNRYEEHQPIEERAQRGLGNGAYPVEDVSIGRGNTVTIDVGERTFVRQFTDPDRLEDGGYEYIVQEGNDVRVPLTATWSSE